MLKKVLNYFSNIKFTIRYMADLSHWFIFITFISSILTAIYNIYNVYIVKIIIQSLMNNNTKLFFILLIIMFSISFFINITNNLISHFFTPILNNKIERKVKWDIYNTYLKYQYEELNKPEFYNLYRYVLNNSFKSFVTIVNILGKIFSNALSIVGISALFTRYDASILFIIFFGVLISFSLSLILSKKRYLFNIDLIPLNRKIEYIARIFYLPEYSDEVHSNKNKSIFYDFFIHSNMNILSIIKKWRGLLSSLSFLESFVIILVNILILLKLGFNFFDGKIYIDSFAMLFSGTQ